MRQRYHHQRPDDVISASEIGSWVYCPESWRLEYGLGMESGNQRSLAAGNRHHVWKTLAERVAGGAIMLGRLLAFLAVVALLLMLWWWL